jgi:dCMP deaminase
MSTGYNGVPKGFPHCTDTPCGAQDAASSCNLHGCMAVHAEQNALLQCDDINEIETIYITTSPCVTCAKLIANTSCKLVVFSEMYSDMSGVKMLRKLNIQTLLNLKVG